MEKTLESPLDCKEIKQVNPKRISPEYSLEGLMLKLKLQYFVHLVRRVGSLEKTLMLGKIEGGRRERQRMRWLDGITDWMDMSLSNLRKLEEAWPAAVYEVTKSRTCLSDWTELNIYPSQRSVNEQHFFLVISSLCNKSLFGYISKLQISCLQQASNLK